MCIVVIMCAVIQIALAMKDNEQQLYCQFGVALCLGKIQMRVWGRLCKMLSYSRYISPYEGYLNPALLDTIYSKTRKTGPEMMRFALLIGQIEAHFTEEEQNRMLSILISRRR